MRVLFIYWINGVSAPELYYYKSRTNNSIHFETTPFILSRDVFQGEYECDCTICLVEFKIKYSYIKANYILITRSDLV